MQKINIALITHVFEVVNNTYMEELVLYWKIHWYKIGCIWRFSYAYTTNEVVLISLSYRCLKNVIHQIAGSKNELLLLSVTFTAKLEVIFVLTFKNAFSYSFYF